MDVAFDHRQDDSNRPRYSRAALGACAVLVIMFTGCGSAGQRTQVARTASISASAVHAFPTFPGSVWDGDTTTQEADGHLTWLVSWTAPAGEASVRAFFFRELPRLGWQIVAGEDRHQISLRYPSNPRLRGLLRFDPPAFGKHGTGIVLGLVDPAKRQQVCLEAIPELPLYAGAAMRLCELTHTPGHLNYLVFLATMADAAVVQRTYIPQLIQAGWNADGAVPGVLLLRQQTGETARLILGPDVTGRLATGIMISVDLPEGSLRGAQILGRPS